MGIRKRAEGVGVGSKGEEQRKIYSSIQNNKKGKKNLRIM